MRILFLFMLLMALVLGTLQAEPGWKHKSHDRFHVDTTLHISKSLHFGGTSGGRTLVVDNISGNVSVEGYDGDAVEIEAVETLRGESADRLAEGLEKITLELTAEGNKVRAYVNTPWRCKGRDCDGSNHYGFDADFDFRIRVPFKTSVRASTVNNGDVEILRVHGPFQAHNVNGAIRIEEAAVSGEATTVNGGITCSFIDNPADACSFETVNGSIEARFQKDLSADLTCSTFNGRVYSDFPGTSGEGDDDDTGSHRHHGRRDTHLRIGSGGKDFGFNTLNGNIRILGYKN